MAWQPPQSHRNAFLHAVFNNHMNNLAPIDQPIAPTGSVPQGIQSEKGSIVGNINPLTQPQGQPVGEANPIEMRVKPRLIHSDIRHSLGSSLGITNPKKAGI